MIFENAFNRAWPDLSKWRADWAKYGALALFPSLVSTTALAEPIRILALGDSLTAGYMLDAGSAFPAKLEKALKAQGYDVVIINAGVSGDTSQGGRARLAWALSDKPDFAILELGANDALRGINPRHVYDNLDAIMAMLKEKDIPIFLAGMMAPRNLGTEYAKEFDAVYPALQEKHNVPLYPFFLQGVLGDPSLTLPDGIHPSAKGVDRIVENIMPHIADWLGPVLEMPTEAEAK